MRLLAQRADFRRQFFLMDKAEGFMTAAYLQMLATINKQAAVRNPLAK